MIFIKMHWCDKHKNLHTPDQNIFYQSETTSPSVIWGVLTPYMCMWLLLLCLWAGHFTQRVPSVCVHWRVNERVNGSLL